MNVESSGAGCHVGDLNLLSLGSEVNCQVICLYENTVKKKITAALRQHQVLKYHSWNFVSFQSPFGFTLRFKGYTNLVSG